MNMQLGRIALRALAALLFAGVSIIQLAGQSAYVPDYVTRAEGGFKPAGTYQVSDFESIDVVSGNVNLAIPLASLPAGRAGLSLGLSLVYNSQVIDLAQSYETYPTGGGGTEQIVSKMVNSETGGWRYGYQFGLYLDDRGSLAYAAGAECSSFVTLDEAVTHPFKLYLALPDGSRHVLHLRGYAGVNGYYPLRPSGVVGCSLGGVSSNTNNPLHYYTADGSFIHVVVDDDGAAWTDRTWTAYLPDGRRVVGKYDDTQAIYDRNGNEITVAHTYDVYSQKTETVLTDDMGRALTIDYDFVTGSNPKHRVTTQGYGQALNYDVTWGSVSITHGASYECAAAGPYCSISGAYGITHDVVTQIDLPTTPSVAWHFGYSDNADEGYGEIDNVTLPSGATIAYEWEYEGENKGVTDTLTINRVTKKTITHDGEPNEIWTYVYDADPGTTVLTTVNNSDGGQVKHHYRSTLYGSPTWAQGLVYKVEEPSGDVVERVWAENAPYHPQNSLYPGARNPYAQAEIHKIVGGAAGMTASVYDRNGNVTESTQSSFTSYTPSSSALTSVPGGSTALRKSTTTFYGTTSPASSSQPTSDESSGYWYPPASAGRVIRTVLQTKVLVGTGTTTASMSEFDYDDPDLTANLTQQRQWLAAQPGSAPSSLNSTNAAVTSWTYDSYGNVLTQAVQRDAQTNITTKWTYGSVSGYTSLYPTQIERAYNTSVERTETFTYDFNTGHVLTAVDTDNVVTKQFAYDKLGRTNQIDIKDGSTILRQTKLFYEDDDRTVAVQTAQLTATDGKIQSVTYYDELGRVRLAQQSVTSNLISGGSVLSPSSGISEVETRYRMATGGAYQLVSNPYSGSGSSPTGWMCSTVDEAGRPEVTAYYSGSSAPSSCTVSTNRTGRTLTSYQGSTAGLVTTVEELAADGDKKRSLVTDPFGRLLQVTEDPGGLGYATNYGYNVLDNLTAVDQGSVDRTFAYDTRGRLTSATNPESGQITYTFLKDGLLQTRQDARGVTLTNGYNPLGQLITQTYTDTTPAATFEYGTATPNFGRLTRVRTDGVTTKDYAYDKLGRITSSTQWTDGQSYPFAYAYNKDDSVTSMTYPSGTKTVVYGYNQAGQPTTAGRTGNPTYYVQAATYAPHGAPASMTLGNGVVEQTTYNSRLQPATMQAGSLLTLTFDYNSTNNNGNILSQTITAGTWSVQQHYRYDQLSRISIVSEQAPPSGSAPNFSCPTTGTGVWCRELGYDRYGNRAVIDAYNGGLSAATPTTTGAYSSSTNRLTTTWAEHDAAGNLTHFKFPGQSALDWTAAYNGENKQRYYCAGDTNPCTSSNDDAEYVYDGEGNRVQKITPSEAVTYAYDAFGRLAAEYSTASSGMTPSSYFRTTDHLGSTRLVTNGSGSVYDRRDFFPFGEAIPASGTYTRASGTIAGYNNSNPASRHLFTAKERDDESGLDYFGARYFGSSLGRFTSADAPFLDQTPVDPQSWNLYAYVRNRPLFYVDPTGNYVCASSVTTEQCDTFQQSLEQAQTAANSLKEKYGEDSKQYTEAQAAIGAYGQRDQDNGVTIAIGDTGNNGAITTVGNTAGPITSDNKNGQNVTVTFNPDFRFDV